MRHSKDTRLDELQPAHGENKIPCKARRQLRRLLFMTTFGGAIITAPQIANAATHVLTGAQTTTQTVTTDTDSVVTVNTDNTFSVNATSGDALTISGAGSITYDDLGNNNTLSTTGAGGNGLSITSTGDNAGPPAENGSITVISGGTISGANDGIFATNAGTGGISITTTGNVSGGFAGIEVSNTNVLATGDVTVNTSGTVEGGTYGISVINDGLGATSVTSTNTVASTSSDGINILASNTGNTNDVTVSVADVTGVTNGILVENDGTGDTSVTSSGTVSGNTGDGIHVLAANNGGAGAGNLTISANDAISVLANGIFAQNDGTGSTSITTNGDVYGGIAGIYIQTASTTNPTTLTINSGSVVHNSSNNPANLAIQINGAGGGTATLSNSGTIIGNVVLGAENDTLTNDGTWNNTGGTSDFGAGTDVFNNEGSFLAASTTGISTTTVNGIETVNNTGDIVMQNTDPRIGGGTAYVGDSTTFINGGSGTFNADSGTLYVDTNIATQNSDRLYVDNVIGGTTGVDVNVVDGLGLPTTGDGIRIVDVGGTSSANAFALTSPLTAGLYDYQLNEGESDPSWFLQSAVRPEAVATGVLPILGSRTALSTLSNLHDRQRDENALSNDDESRKGVWGRVFGQSNDYNANDANDFGFNSRVWGVQAGLDLMASGDNLGNRKYAGLYVAYASASGDARQFDNKVANLDLNATTIGAYYTKYSSGNWYLDLVAQYSSLGGIHARTATDNVSPGGKSYALSLEAGKQFHPDSRIVREVQAQLIDQYTDMDSVTLNDGSHVNVSGLNAVTGRFGLRLYGNPKGGKSFLPWFRANIWHTFSGDSTISSLGSSINTPIGGTSGELELGFTKGNAQSGGWGFYGSAGYLFHITGAEYSGWKGSLGLRKGW